ncbi:hypothetical protein [Acaryochloris sp. CCMEE 5410]|uniref:hypothetical protein n=1 Tax=Acaryochloris sp. CCMEE 5410 TaxID=310037 RepID=UPI00024844D2|nr:hypothetical protein [Acaryochloris sp. CCMEE 5410]KAI9129748.1 hypothetical protein ON05_031895 [Acaryochloris sp. CCMEE 5410]
MSSEEQQFREALQIGQQAVNATNSVIINAVALRKPRVAVKIETAEQAMELAKQEIRNNTPTDVIKTKLRMSDYAEKVQDPTKMAERYVKSAQLKVAVETHGHKLNQNRNRGQNRGFGR